MANITNFEELANARRENIAGRLRAMEVGTQEAFALRRMNYVRYLCSTLPHTTGRRFMTHINAERGVIEVFRME